MLETQNEIKWKVISLILVAVIIFGGLFTALYNKNIKVSNIELESKITSLEETNKRLSDNLSSLNSDIEATAKSSNDKELNEKYFEVANKFIKLYPMFDIEKVEQKRSDLESVATESVATSIVPDDMIASTKKTLESDPSSKAGEAYSSDPTFKSAYKDSKMYIHFVSAKLIQYFAEVTYATQSSSGDTEETVYILFDVSNDNGKTQVTNYEIKYFN